MQRTIEVGAPIYAEGNAKVPDLIKALVSVITGTSTYTWNLEYPAGIGDIADIAILSTMTTFNKKFYVKLERKTLYNMELQIAAALNATNDDLDETNSSAVVPFGWYTAEGVELLNDWLPVEFWLNFNQDSINLVVQGDPSVDKHPYDNYLISYCYIGSVLSYENADADDYNFMLTAGSAQAPIENTKFGVNTGNGVTDVISVGTRTGVPYQAHEIKNFSGNPYADTHYITSSRYTKKFHFSDIVVTHKYDRERGKLQNVLVGERDAITHLDELLENKGLEDEKAYLMINFNSPFSFINNSNNIHHGLALRKR